MARTHYVALMTDPLKQYRCRHGHLVLGCPDDKCPEQTDYLTQLVEGMRRHEEHQVAAAREAVSALVMELRT